MKPIRIALIAAFFMLVVSISNVEASDCSSLHSTWDGRQIEVIEQTLTIPFSGRTLHVQPSKNGGVKVAGTSEDGNWNVTVCKTRWERGSDRDAAEVTIEATPERLVADLGDENGWSVFFIIRAPRHASMTATTTNGPISLRDVSGTYSLESKNGPLSLKNVDGTVIARLRNGPISFDDLSGDFDLQTANGPISADFRDTRWRGATIKATTSNGPLSLRSSANFPAGIVVRAEGHGTIRCGEECGELWRDRHGRQSPRVFRFGPATEDVVLTTDNGPVTIDVTRH